MEERSSIEKMTIIKSKTINTITNEDFGEQVNLKFEETINVCFYGEHRDSLHLLRVFVEAADRSEGVNFGVVNLDYEKKIKKRFGNLHDEDHQHHWMRTSEKAFVLTYRKGFPQSFYNGIIDADVMRYYFENVSHLKGHREAKVNPIVKNIDKHDNIYLRTSWK
jgi:hypothetical protein